MKCFTTNQDSILCLVLLLIRTQFCASFNIEERDPIVKKGAPGSYFGFSVAQHLENASPPFTPWILVGAPLGMNLQPDTYQSGALFKCLPRKGAEECDQVETDGNRLDDFDYDDDHKTEFREPKPLNRPGTDELKNGQWLGVSVRSQKFGGKAIVCAHRYIQSQNLSLHHYGLGLCYSLKNNLEVEEALQPCKGRPVEKLHQQFGFCQVGTSADLLDNGFALMGSPGPFTWRGTIFAKEIVGNFFQVDKTVYHGPLNDDKDGIGHIDKYSYLGMSVAGGRFFRHGNISYASGAPRSQFTGEVYFFDRIPNSEILNFVLKITGEQFASSFGYEILAVDLNNDGLEDLLVGAPFYYDSSFGGAVYIYMNLQNCVKKPSCNHTAILKGKLESRFGFSMTSLGDINKDGFVDVAIGAPYEDDTGAVHIYLGTKEGLSRKPSQIIKYPVTMNLKTIGYSLSGGLDMDGNGYPDLLVGAYESDRAILYRTREIIDIDISVSGDELQNINTTRKGCSKDMANTNNTCFSFETCFKIRNYRNQLNIKYEIRELASNTRPQRIWFKNEISKSRNARKGTTISVDPAQRKCLEETVYLNENVGDILTPIKFKVNYTLAEDMPNSPILNTTSVKEFEATFQKSCGEDDKCESELILEVGTQLNRSDNGEYIFDLGKNNEFVLEADVRNDGESAYEAKMYVFHPDSFSYIAVLSERNKSKSVINCSYKNKTVVICNLGNPFQERQKANIKLRFEVNNISDQKVELQVLVNSTSEEKSVKTREFLTVVLEKIAEYRLEGQTKVPNFVVVGRVKGESDMKSLEDIGSRVTHTYQVVNHGQWVIPEVEIVILWPYEVQPREPHKKGKHLLYLERVPKLREPNSCFVEPVKATDPLDLRSASEFSEEEERNITTPKTFQDVPENVRRKRDTDDVIDWEIKNEADGKKRRVVTMHCLKRTAKCAKIICKIKNLNSNDPVDIQVHSRIWNSTLVEDYANVDWVSIWSVATLTISDPTIIHSNTSVGESGVETIFYPNRVATGSAINIWIIVGSIILGLLVFIILVVILYKVGFFKRNRIKDQTLSGNLQKNDAEQQNLLQTQEKK